MLMDGPFSMLEAWSTSPYRRQPKKTQLGPSEDISCSKSTPRHARRHRSFRLRLFTTVSLVALMLTTIGPSGCFLHMLLVTRLQSLLPIEELSTGF